MQSKKQQKLLYTVNASKAYFAIIDEIDTNINFESVRIKVTANDNNKVKLTKKAQETAK